jgi:hypothetical protein
VASSGAVLRYVNSQEYTDDFQVARRMWKKSPILGGSGMFIFATYATLPSLTTVGSDAGDSDALMLRKAVGEGRAKDILVRLFNLDDDIGQPVGLADPGVRRMLSGLGERHRALRGMRDEYIDMFAGIVAISCLRLRSSLKITVETDELRHYWRYMHYSLAAFGAELGEYDAVSASCARFVQLHSGASRQTGIYLAHLFATYPKYISVCGRALFPETRRVVSGLLTAELPDGWPMR